MAVRLSLKISLCILFLAGCSTPPAVTPAPPQPTATPSPLALSTAAPATVAPTVTLGPAALAVEPMPNNPLERRRLSPGEPVAQAGLYFMQVATGEIEAWALPGEESARYDVSPDNRWVTAYARYSTYAADRRTGAAYRWGRNSLHLLAAQGDYLLFRNDAGQVWIAGPGQSEPVALPIRPSAPQPVVSPDGQTAAVVSGHALYLVELASAACRAIGEVADPPESSVQWLGLQTARRGEAIVLTASLITGTDQSAVQHVQRYSWRGELLDDMTLPGGRTYAFSPDERLVAWQEQLSHLTQAVVVADAATLAPRFRVSGGSLCFYDIGFGDWLADSSGLIVRTSAGYRIVTSDGDMLTSPALPIAAGEPLPAPDRSDLIAIGRTAVIDTNGRRLASAVLGPAGSQWSMPADIYPWGLDSSELRFALPHLGHGGKCEGEYLLPARVERPSFGPLVLAVGLPANDCINLHAAPGRSAQVLTCLPGGTRLSPAPSAAPTVEPGESEGGVYYLTSTIAWTDDSLWLRVHAPDGQEGWVDEKAGEIGWAP